MKLTPLDINVPVAAQHRRSRDWTLRRNAAGLIESFAIAEQWKLTQDQLSLLLGVPVRTLQRWRKQSTETARLELGEDTLERLSYLLGISKALAILFPTQTNRLVWLSNGNTSPLFNGQAPMQRMLGGRVSDLFVVRRYLDAARG